MVASYSDEDRHYLGCITACDEKHPELNVGYNPFRWTYYSPKYEPNFESEIPRARNHHERRVLESLDPKRVELVRRAVGKGRSVAACNQAFFDMIGHEAPSKPRAQARPTNLPQSRQPRWKRVGAAVIRCTGER